MADDERGFDDDEEEEEQVEETKGRLSKKIILIVAAVLLIAGLSGGGAYFMSKGGGDEVAVEDGEDGEEEDEEEEEEEEEDLPKTPYYFSLNPPFVVNFVGKSRAKFLQVNIDGLTRDPLLKEDITTHLPQIRNNIVLLLSSKSYDELIAPEGKESLRKDVLSEVRKILRKETGKDEIEDIYFTSFVMQ